MKHLKIFEEFEIKSGSEMSEYISLTNNEIALIKKTGANVSFYGTVIYVNNQSVNKVEDGWYIVNHKIKCSSIQDAIKVCNEQNDKMISDLDELFNSDDIEVTEDPLILDDGRETEIETMAYYVYHKNKRKLMFKINEDNTIIYIYLETFQYMLPDLPRKILLDVIEDRIAEYTQNYDCEFETLTEENYV